jgi:phosphatidylinositol dimannoside acyltransferase
VPGINGPEARGVRGVVPPRAKLKARLTGLGYALGWSALCRVPESWAAWAFRFSADIAWRRQGKSVQLLEGNLLRVIGPEFDGAQLRALSREAMRSYARYWLEIFRLPVMSREMLVEGMDENGAVDTMLGHLAAGRGVVIPLPHMGNWDQAAAWVIGRGVATITTVMERLEPESVYERFLAFRQEVGLEVLPASGGPSPFGVLAQRLRRGGLVVLPSDRDVTGGGVEVDFFGERALMMGGSAALAVQTGAALMPATLWFTDEGWGVHIHEEIPVPAVGERWQKAAAMTQEVARCFEKGIREHPADWHMLQRVFVSDLDPQRLAAARVKAAARQRAAERNGKVAGDAVAGDAVAGDAVAGDAVAGDAEASAPAAGASEAGSP